MSYKKIILNKLKMLNIVIKVFKGILDHYNEKLYNAFSRIDNLKHLLKNNITIINEITLIKAINKGNGVILVTGHFGGIEFLPSVVAIKGYSISIICRFQDQVFSKRIRERAQMVGINLIETGKTDVIKAALLTLKNGGILVTECDELNLNNRKNSKYVSFLGYKIHYDRTIDILQKKSGATVLFGLVKRKPRKRYELILFNEIMNTDESNITCALGEKCLNLLEIAIYSNPEQWYQWNKFAHVIIDNYNNIKLLNFN